MEKDASTERAPNRNSGDNSPRTTLQFPPHTVFIQLHRSSSASKRRSIPTKPLSASAKISVSINRLIPILPTPTRATLPNLLRHHSRPDNSQPTHPRNRRNPQHRPRRQLIATEQDPEEVKAVGEGNQHNKPWLSHPHQSDQYTQHQGGRRSRSLEASKW